MQRTRSRLELLAGNLLALGHEALGAIELHDERVAFVPLRHASHELSLTLRELIEQRHALVLSEPLRHHLLGGLRRDATELLLRDRGAGSICLVAPDRDRPVDSVDAAPECVEVLGGIVLAHRTDHRLLEILHKQFPVDILLPRKMV